MCRALNPFLITLASDGWEVAGCRLRFFFIFFFGAVVTLLLDEDDREAAAPPSDP